MQGLGFARGLTNSLVKRDQNTQRCPGKGKNAAAHGQVSSFINQVNAQSGKKIVLEDAVILIAAAELVLRAI